MRLPEVIARQATAPLPLAGAGTLGVPLGGTRRVGGLLGVAFIRAGRHVDVICEVTHTKRSVVICLPNSEQVVIPGLSKGISATLQLSPYWSLCPLLLYSYPHHSFCTEQQCHIVKA